MSVKLGIGRCKDWMEEGQVGDGGVERGQHEVPDAKEREASHGRRGSRGPEDEEQHLDDIMVALEIVQGGVAAQDLDDDV